MTFGPASLLALAAAALATLLWWLARGRNEVLAVFLFGLALALVVLAGPLVQLP